MGVVMSDLSENIERLMKANRRTHGDYRYTVPSPDTYPYQWLWDSCFHAILLSHFDTDMAKDELRALLSKQFKDGMVPHMIYWEPGEVINFDWGKAETSSITQPPMIAYAVWRVFEATGDEQFLKDTYRSLFHFYKYLLNERDPHDRHLVGIINPDESGEDNSPRFDELLDLPPQHELQENLKRRLALVKENKKCDFDAPFCMKNFFWVKDVPFNAIMIKNLESLSRIARKLDRSYDAEYFKEERERMIKSMRELMQDGLKFYSTYGEKYHQIPVDTWALFSPLFAGMLTSDEAQKLVQNYLLDMDAFWTEYPVATVSKQEPSYDPQGFWRGPVWTSVNWFIYKGLRAYGMDDIAAGVRQGSIELVEQSGFREYFDPGNGRGYGAENFTWGALVLDMN